MSGSGSIAAEAALDEIAHRVSAHLASAIRPSRSSSSTWLWSRVRSRTLPARADRRDCRRRAPSTRRRPARGTLRTSRAVCGRARLLRRACTTRSCARASDSVRNPCGSNTGSEISPKHSFSVLTVTSAALRAMSVAAHAVDDHHEQRVAMRDDVHPILVLRPVCRPGSALHNRRAPCTVPQLVFSSSHRRLAAVGSEPLMYTRHRPFGATECLNRASGLNRMPHSMTGFATAEVARGAVAVGLGDSQRQSPVSRVGLPLARGAARARARMPRHRRRPRQARQGRLHIADRRKRRGRRNHGRHRGCACRSCAALQDRVRAVFPDARPLTTQRGAALARSTEGARRELERARRAGQGMPCASAGRAAGGAPARGRAHRARCCENGSPGSRIDRGRDQAACSTGAQARYRDRLQERLQRLRRASAAGTHRAGARDPRAERATSRRKSIGSRATSPRSATFLGRDEPVGRRLDFVIQELNREANTFASKVQEESLTRAAVELKVLIEQMREQVQNLE